MVRCGFNSRAATNRLGASFASAIRTAAWSYDVFGNRVSTYSSDNSCGIVPLRYGPDNGWWPGTRRRAVPASTTGAIRRAAGWARPSPGYTAPPADSGLRTTLSYTAGGQLYYAVTPTDDIGHWDYTWHWYDGQGRRLMSELVPYHQGRDALDPKTVTGGRRDYYIYDGQELTLTLRHGSDGGWRVAQRILSAGLDGALAGRYWTPDAGSPQSLFVLRDRQGTTLGAYRADGTADPLSWYQPLGAFGAPAGGVNLCIHGAALLNFTSPRCSVCAEPPGASASSKQLALSHAADTDRQTPAD